METKEKAPFGATHKNKTRREDTKIISETEILDQEIPSAIMADAERCELEAKAQPMPQQPCRKFVTLAELLRNPVVKIPCLIDPFFHKVGLAAFVGASDAGKSSFLRYMCMCITSGRTDFLGYPVYAEHKSVIYISSEDDETAISFLAGKQNKCLNEDISKFEGFRFLFDTENVLEILDEELTIKPADLICIDAFGDMFDGDMNKSNIVRSYLNSYMQIAKKHKCLVMFLHHCAKRKQELTPHKDNILGSQGFEAKMRLVMELREDPIDPKIRHLCIVKGNYLCAEAKRESYVLHFTEDMIFINTGSRVSLDNIVKIEEKNESKEKYERIKKLRAENVSWDKIAEIENYKDRSSALNFVKRYEKNQNVVGMLSDVVGDNNDDNNVVLTFPVEKNND